MPEFLIQQVCTAGGCAFLTSSPSDTAAPTAPEEPQSTSSYPHHHLPFWSFSPNIPLTPNTDTGRVILKTGYQSLYSLQVDNVFYRPNSYPERISHLQTPPYLGPEARGPRPHGSLDMISLNPTSVVSVPSDIREPSRTWEARSQSPIFLLPLSLGPSSNSRVCNV